MRRRRPPTRNWRASGTAGYRNLARLREAAVLADRDPKAAVAAL